MVKFKELKVGDRVRVMGNARNGTPLNTALRWRVSELHSNEWVGITLKWPGLGVSSDHFVHRCQLRKIVKKPRREWWLLNDSDLLEQAKGAFVRSSPPSEAEKQDWMHVREVKRKTK